MLLPPNGGDCVDALDVLDAWRVLKPYTTKSVSATAPLKWVPPKQSLQLPNRMAPTAVINVTLSS
jgi:hypothetical protein